MVTDARFSLLHRERPEKEYAPLYKKYGLKTTVFSALLSGILTGKYNDGIPEDSRLANDKNNLSHMAQHLKTPEGQAKIQKVRELTELAKGFSGSHRSSSSSSDILHRP